MNQNKTETFLATMQDLNQQYLVSRNQLNELKIKAKNSDWNESVASEIIEQLAALHERGRQANQEFTALDEETKRSEKTQSALATVTEQIKSLLAIIDELENSAKQSRNQLLPQINASIRSFQMHRAYSAEALG